MQRLLAVARLLRSGNLLLLALAQTFLQYTVIRPILAQADIEPTLGHGSFAMLVLATLLVAAGGYAINDYFDVRVDMLNRPGSLIVGHSLHRREAILLHQVLTFIGIGLAAWVAWKALNFKLAFVHLLAAALLWLYSSTYKRKRFIGNLVIAMLTAFAVGVVALYERQLFHPVTPNGLIAARTVLIIVIGYLSFAFIASLARELVKDMQDMEGDRLVGHHTVPLMLGLTKSKWISGIMLLLLACGVAYIQWLQWGSGDYTSVFTMFIIFQLPLASALYLLINARSKNQFRTVHLLIKLVMLLGVLSMAYFYFLSLA